MTKLVKILRGYIVDIESVSEVTWDSEQMTISTHQGETRTLYKSEITGQVNFDDIAERIVTSSHPGK